MEEGPHSKAVSETVGQLAARWAQADKQILRKVFPLLSVGRPVPVSLIAEATDREPAIVEAALEAGRAGRDKEGRVVELSGLMLSPTIHRVQIDDVALFSCCALLAQLVPQLVDRAVTVESIDPVSRRIVRLTITPQRLAAVEPAGAVASFVSTEPGALQGDVGALFCCHVRHFASAESAGAFVAADRRRYLLSIDDLQAAAQMLYREAWAA
jgi:hypothetical protein